MKFVIMLAAWVISASLVVPTVFQGQDGGSYEQANAVEAPADPAGRRA